MAFPLLPLPPPPLLCCSCFSCNSCCSYCSCCSGNYCKHRVREGVGGWNPETKLWWLSFGSVMINNGSGCWWMLVGFLMSENGSHGATHSQTQMGERDWGPKTWNETRQLSFRSAILNNGRCWQMLMGLLTRRNGSCWAVHSQTQVGESGWGPKTWNRA